MRHGFNPIVIVLNNQGYTNERFIKDGPFILAWNYHLLPKVLGAGRGFLVQTECDFEESWNAAMKTRGEYCLLNVRLDTYDHSEALRRLGKRLASKVRRG